MKNKKKNHSKKNNKNRNNSNRKPNVNNKYKGTSQKNNLNKKSGSRNSKSNNSNKNSKNKQNINSNVNKKVVETKKELEKENENLNLKKDFKNDKIIETNIIKNPEIQKENVIRIDKEKKENSKAKKTGRTVKVWVLLLIILIVFLLFFILLFGINRFSNKIQTNIYIENIDISKLTADEAKSKIESEYSNVTAENIKFLYQDKTYEIKLEDIDFNLKIDDSINQAIEYGRNNNIAIAIKDFYLLKLGKNKNISLNYTYNKDKLNAKLEEFQKEFYQEVQQYSYNRTEDNKLQITNGVKGIKINFDSVEKVLDDAIDTKSLVEPIETPLIIEEPEQIDVDKIHNEVFIEVKDAYYTTDPFEIHDEIIGINFDVDSLKNMIETEPEKTEYVIDLIITEPAIKVDNLDLYNDELGRCSTYYVNNPNRTVNLRLAANKINGYILMPGETFSYNDVVGERTVSAGYRNAAIYVNGEVEDGLAGGICQISSTLYNAVVSADLEIVERSNHARVPSYLPAGKDATVYWGSKDFKFKNNRSFPVRISISVEGGYATAIINGKQTDNEYDISIETSVVSRYNGYLVVNAYKVYRQNGVVINREWLSTDSYKI